MKLNKKFIQQLRNGEITAENNGTLEQLIEVLKAAFPEDSVIPLGNGIYYSRSYTNTYGWVGSQFLYEDKPTFKISEFYQPELFTGWAKDDSCPKWMMYFENDIPKFGFNAHGDWRGEHNLGRYSSFEDNRPATHEEIEQGLAEEAKRRGYKKGVTCLFRLPSVIWERTLHTDSFEYIEGLGLINGCKSNIVFDESMGQWAGIVKQPDPKPQPKKSTTLNYLVDGVEYSFNYQELKEKYEDICQYSDEQFMEELPQIAHLACIVAYFKGLGMQATISDKGVIHELIHLMTEPNEPTNDLQEIREKFNKLIQLV